MCKTPIIYSSNYLGEIDYPLDNKQDSLKIDLGRKLFFDTRLSADESVSCATCHKPGLAFTDGKEVSDGVFGRKTARNSPSILNAAYLPRVMFDGELKTLEMQVIVPIQEHNEMGMNMMQLIKKLRDIDEYQKAAKKIFNRDFDPWVLTRSIAAFERTLLAKDSKFDEFYYGKRENAISAKAKRGWELFSSKLYCTSCHPAPFFTNFELKNNGYTNLQSEDLGRFRIHGDSADIGVFKVPSLRNLSVTGPYMHDGKLECIEDVLKHYQNGGNRQKNQDKTIVPFTLTKKEIEELKAFFATLSSNSFLND